MVEYEIPLEHKGGRRTKDEGSRLATHLPTEHSGGHVIEHNDMAKD